MYVNVVFIRSINIIAVNMQPKNDLDNRANLSDPAFQVCKYGSLSDIKLFFMNRSRQTLDGDITFGILGAGLSKQRKVIEYLVQKGGKWIEWTHTYLQAVRRNYIDIVECLLVNHINITQSNLMQGLLMAFGNGNFQIIDLIVDSKQILDIKWVSCFVRACGVVKKQRFLNLVRYIVSKQDVESRSGFLQQMVKYINEICFGADIDEFQNILFQRLHEEFGIPLDEFKNVSPFQSPVPVVSICGFVISFKREGTRRCFKQSCVLKIIRHITHGNLTNFCKCFVLQTISYV